MQKHKSLFLQPIFTMGHKTIVYLIAYLCDILNVLMLQKIYNVKHVKYLAI